MYFLENLYKKNLKHNLVNKFIYKNSKKLPSISKIILNFGSTNTSIKCISSNLLALELITNQKSKMTFTKHSNILLKIRKGNPTGCKITLRKKSMLSFFSRLLTETFPKLKKFNNFKVNTKNKTFSFKLVDILNFPELENQYYLFNLLPNLNITIITNTKNSKELKFILTTLKFPFNPTHL